MHGQIFQDRHLNGYFFLFSFFLYFTPESDQKNNHRKVKYLCGIPVCLHNSFRPNPGFLRYRSFLIVWWCFSILPVSGQQVRSAELSLGFGYPEWLHAGVRFKMMEQVKLGLYLGTMPSMSKMPIRMQVETQIHLWGEERDLEFGKWYIRTGMMYGEDPSNDHSLHFFDFFSGFGREWFYSNDFGFQIDAGVHVLPYARKEYAYFREKVPFRMIPGLRLQIFYRSSRYLKQHR